MPNNKVNNKSLMMLVALALSLMLSACTMAPKYTRPDAPIPNVYASGEGEDAPKNMPWRDFFKDPGIQRVVGLSLEHNRDLRIALLNVEKARSLYRIQRADLLPTISAAGAGERTSLGPSVSSTGERFIQEQYSGTLGFSSFELDLFGRVRSLYEASVEQYHSIANDAQRARLTLVSEVAAMYLQMVADKEIRDITAETFENRKKSHETIKLRHNNGIASQLELNQARTIMEEARAELARMEAQLGQSKNALALLIGTELPADLPDVRSLGAVQALPDVPEGLPSTLVERRPDIMSAEHRLKSANANIGAARANFFPNISLTGNLGTLSAEFSDLFSSGTRTWSFMPQVTLPIFDTGRNIALLDGATADRDIAVAEYEKSIQVAFREVGDCLVQREFIGEQLSAQKDLLDATKMTYSLADTRYSVGIDSMLTLLDAQRSLYSAQRSYISAQLLRETNALTLYKALGGGWY